MALFHAFSHGFLAPVFKPVLKLVATLPWLPQQNHHVGASA